MTYYLFLDDERNPRNVTWEAIPHNVEWKIVRNYNAFVNIITEYGVPKFISFDHDLADFHYEAMIREVNGEQNVDYGTEKTGYDCARWLINYCMDEQVEFPEYVVHSMNPIGKKRIIDYVELFKRMSS